MNKGKMRNFDFESLPTEKYLYCNSKEVSQEELNQSERDQLGECFSN